MSGPAFYAALGLHTLRLWGVQPGGACQCGRPSCAPRSAGKHPIRPSWQNTPPDLVFGAGENIGLKMGGQPSGAACVAFDVDEPEAFAALQAQLGPLPETLRTETGRGFHLIFQVLPALLPLLKNFVKRSGLDLRAEGGQVVAAPSWHHSGKAYVLSCASPPAWLPWPWVEWLVQSSAARPQEGVQGEPCPLPQDDRWLELARAAATETPSEPGLGGHCWKLALRLRRGLGLRPETALTLLEGWSAGQRPRAKLERAVAQAGSKSDLPWGFARPMRPGSLNAAESPAELVAALPPVLPGEPAHAERLERGLTYSNEAFLRIMNGRHHVLSAIGGKFRILSWGVSQINPLWRIPILQSDTDFVKGYSNIRIHIEGHFKRDANGETTGELAQVVPGKAWLDSPYRAQSSTLCFEPLQPRELRGMYNLWNGYGVEPKPGAWPLMREFMRDIVASGDAIADVYIYKWMAWVLQHPGERADVVLVLRGKKGTGKNTIFDVLCEMLGQHSLTVSSPRHLTGNFNAHLQDCALLFANEAIPPNDKPAESILKSLVTDRTLSIERKGIDLVPVPNKLSICMASNEEWCVPAGHDERRFAVFDISSERMQDHAYFGRLRAELAAGGREAMLHDLLTARLGDWHPRQCVPKTSALVEQQLHSLRGAERIIYHMLATGRNTGALPDVKSVSEEGETFCSTRQLASASGKAQTDERALALALEACGGRKVVVTYGFNNRQARGYWLPELKQARADWSESVRLEPAWAEAEEWIEETTGF